MYSCCPSFCLHCFCCLSYNLDWHVITGIASTLSERKKSFQADSDTHPSPRKRQNEKHNAPPHCISKQPVLHKSWWSVFGTPITSRCARIAVLIVLLFVKSWGVNASFHHCLLSLSVRFGFLLTNWIEVELWTVCYCIPNWGAFRVAKMFDVWRFFCILGRVCHVRVVVVVIVGDPPPPTWPQTPSLP